MRRARIAAKAWCCHTCGDDILPGHVYEDTSFCTDHQRHRRGWYNIRRCAECANVEPNEHHIGRKPNVVQRQPRGRYCPECNATYHQPHRHRRHR